VYLATVALCYHNGEISTPPRAVAGRIRLVALCLGARASRHTTWVAESHVAKFGMPERALHCVTLR